MSVVALICYSYKVIVKMNYNLISVLHLMSCKCKLCCHAILRSLHCYQKPQKRSFTAFTTTSDLVWSDVTFGRITTMLYLPCEYSWMSIGQFCRVYSWHSHQLWGTWAKGKSKKWLKKWKEKKTADNLLVLWTFLSSN